MKFLRLILASFVVTAFFPPIFLASVPLLARTRKVLKVEYFENCDQKEYAVMFFRFTFGRNGTILILNGEEIVSRDIKNPIKINFLIDKCKDKSNPDTCEYYTTWKWDDLCVAHNLPFVQPYLTAYTPPLTCPMKKNHHFIKNAGIPTTLVEPFLAHSNPNSLWKFRIKLEEPGSTVIACIDTGVRLMATRVRN